jgi:NAD+ diphosphatase
VEVQLRPARTPLLPLSGGFTDRAAHRRKDEQWIRSQLRNERSRVAVVSGQQTLHHCEGDAVRIAWLSPEALPEAVLRESVFLGEMGGGAVFAATVADQGAFAGPAGAEWGELRRHMLLMEPAEAGLLAFARAMAYWHERHRFCGACGSPAESREAGHVRACTGCGALHFPRTDPAVIVRVEHRGRCLLGRQASWDPGVYSVLAGFLEPGESLEDAVAREVLEEAGVRVRDVRYHSSQPWPFPASIMVGFTARTDSAELKVDDELEDARWFSRAGARRALAAGTLRMPSRYSISYRLIEEWLGD